MVACYRRDTRIPTAEKTAEQQIRQNQGILVIVGTTLAIYISNLLVITSFTDAYLADAVKQIIKVICPEYVLSLQTFVIQHKALGKVILSGLV